MTRRSDTKEETNENSFEKQNSKEIIDTFKLKAKYFYDKQLPVHTILWTGRFYNGEIKELTADFFMIDDYKLGIQPIFFIQVRDLEQYKTP